MRCRWQRRRLWGPPVLLECACHGGWQPCRWSRSLVYCLWTPLPVHPPARALPHALTHPHPSLLLLLLQLMTPAAVLSRTNGREAISRGDVEEAHTLFRWAQTVLLLFCTPDGGSLWVGTTCRLALSASACLALTAACVAPVSSACPLLPPRLLQGCQVFCAAAHGAGRQIHHVTGHHWLIALF